MKVSRQLLMVNFSLLLHLATTLDLFVDSTITQQNGNDYPTLKEAVQALYNPTTNILLENNNTITLKSNTIGTTQLLPKLNLNQAQGGISIIFENPPSELTALSDCALLPTLTVSSASNSVFSMTNLDYFFLQGVHIQIKADSASQRFVSMRNVTFDRFCMTSTKRPELFV